MRVTELTEQIETDAPSAAEAPARASEIRLEECRPFTLLRGAHLARLRSTAQLLHYPDGTEIFKEGDPGNGLYLVKTGCVQISALIDSGERQVFSELAMGEMFGEMAVIDEQPRSAAATAAGDCSVYFVPGEFFLELLEACPAMALEMIRQISQRLREFNRHYIQKVLNSERLAVVGRFASSIVHDLKNPLTIISIASDLACLDNATVESRKIAQSRIARQVERISSMVSDILEFTRPTGGSVSLMPTNYAHFIHQLHDEIEREILLKGVMIDSEPAPSVRIAANPQRLNRVFYNLMMNAVDAMPEGGHIRLAFECTDTEVITHIEDSGKGIAPQILPQLFEAFATYGKVRGTGLGLSITRRIVEEHGGHIQARNIPGGGARFTFSLPIVA